MNFSYRDNLWQGSDLLATGIASFGHVVAFTIRIIPNGSNTVARSKLASCRLNHSWQAYVRPPALMRQMILQLKRGYLSVFSPFQR